MKPLGKEVEHYWLVQRMAKATGADLNAAFAADQMDTEVWSELVQSCRGCEWVEGCERWLGRHEEGQSEPPDNCPNANLFATLNGELESPGAK